MMKKTFFVLFLVLIGIRDNAHAAQYAYLWVKSSGDGVIRQFNAESYSGGIVQDTVNGEPRVCFSPLTIVADYGKHTPALAEIACSTDVVVDVSLTIEVTDDSGVGNTQTTVIQIQGARVTSFQFGGFAAEPSREASRPNVSEITFTKYIDFTSPKSLKGRSFADEIVISYTETNLDGMVVERSETRCVLVNCD